MLDAKESWNGEEVDMVMRGLEYKVLQSGPYIRHSVIGQVFGSELVKISVFHLIAST